MNDDLVKRLREYADYRATADDLSQCLFQAADCIEAQDKRNKALAFILMCALADFKSSGNMGEDMFFDWIDDARAALAGEGKDDRRT